jgi:hypothetical protein
MEQPQNIGRVERELDLTDEHASLIVAMRCHDIDLGVMADRRASPPGLRGLPSRAVDQDIRDAGANDVFPDLTQVREPCGLGLDIELSSFEQRAVWIDEAVPVAKKGVADLVAATLAASRMLAEG